MLYTTFKQSFGIASTDMKNSVVVQLWCTLIASHYDTYGGKILRLNLIIQRLFL